MPIEILIKFQIPPNVNKYFDTIFYEIKQSNSKKIDEIIKEIKELNCLTYIKVKMIISSDIRFWNLNKINFEHLNLSGNKLRNLPISFGNIKVEGDLDLSHNLLTSLPENFLKINNDGDINITNNKLESLPKNFYKIFKYYNWKILERTL